MDAQAVLKRFRLWGVALFAHGDRLVVEYDGELRDSDRDLIRVQRDNLVVLLKREQTAPSEPTMPSDQRWRKVVALWSIEWRQRWADLAETYQAAGDPWDEAEWFAFLATEDAIAAAEARGERVPMVESCPALSEASAALPDRCPRLEWRFSCRSDRVGPPAKRDGKERTTSAKRPR